MVQLGYVMLHLQESLTGFCAFSVAFDDMCNYVVKLLPYQLLRSATETKCSFSLYFKNIEGSLYMVYIAHMYSCVYAAACLLTVLRRSVHWRSARRSCSCVTSSWAPPSSSGPRRSADSTPTPHYSPFKVSTRERAVVKQ